MKKLKYFFAGFLPLLIALGIQFFAMFLLLGLTAIYRGVTGTLELSGIVNLIADENFSTSLMLIYALSCICLMVPWYFFLRKKDGLPVMTARPNTRKILGIIFLVPGAQFVCGYIISILSILQPKWLKQYQDLMENAGLSGNITLLMFFYAVIFGPICEELIFRGLTMHWAKKAMPFLAANFFQAVLFGIFHMSWIQGIYAFALGLLLGFICEKAGGIYYSILMHILFNFWGTIIAQFLEGHDTLILGLIMIAVTILSLGAGITLLVLGISRDRHTLVAQNQ